MIGGVTRKSVLMAMAMLALVGTAASHTPPSSLAADRDLRFESITPDHVQPFSAFAELTRIELPPPSIADEFAEKLVSAELVSRPRRFTLQSKSSEWSDLAGKTWGKENKGAPFVEPGTGLVYSRERWYDATAGTFLTPDPESYADSSNLYAYCAADPVNCSDATGRLGYLETGWDLLSLALGVASFRHNIHECSYGMVVVDAFGIVVDATAVLTPVPGGVGAALKASRTAGWLGKAHGIDQTINVGQGVAQSYDEYSQGNLGWGTFYAGMAGLGVRGMDANAFRFSSAGVGSNFGNLRILQKTSEGPTPVADPQRLLAAHSDDFLIESGLSPRRYSRITYVASGRSSSERQVRARFFQSSGGQYRAQFTVGRNSRWLHT